MRRLFSLLALACAALAASSEASERAIRRFEFLGVATLDHRLDVEGTPLGGLSALAWNPEREVFHALSDDFSGHAPARFYDLEIDLGDGRLDEGDVTVVGVTLLLDPEGEPFERTAVDPEGLALAADGRLFFSSEGHVSGGVAPLLAELDLDGQVRRYLPVPERYLPRDGRLWRKPAGVRHNMAFESLTLTPSGEWLFTATENALWQDGPPATLEERSPVRISRRRAGNGKSVAEYLYWTEPVAQRGFVPPDDPTVAGVLELAGLVELLALDDNRLLALERSYSTGAGNAVRLFEVDLTAAADISGVSRLDRRPGLEAARKTFVMDLASFLARVDNVEGLAFGPRLEDGRRTLFLISDDNFNPRQTTQVLAFAFEEEPATVAEIQGPGHASPLAGQWVLDTPGVVTVVVPDDHGGVVWIADPGEPEVGLAAYIWNVSALSPGDRIMVSGQVEERGRSDELPHTRLRDGFFERLGPGELPAPVRIGAGGRMAPAAHVDDDGFERFEPEDDAADFFESLEGARVEIADGLVVGPGNRFKECVVVADGAAGTAPRTRHGGLLLAPTDFNPERLILDTRLLDEPCRAAVGSRFTAPITGVVDYDFGTYRVIADQPLPPTVGGAEPDAATTLIGGPEQLTLASFNVENLEPTDEKIPDLARVIVVSLGAPDVVALQEVQDESGRDDDGIAAGAGTFEALIEAIAAAGGPRYDFHQIDPEDGADGGRPGGNIRVGFLIDPARARVTRRDRPGADAVEVRSDEAGPYFFPNPGRVSPDDPSFATVDELGYRATRKPLALEIEFNGRRIFLINAHLKSKSGDDRLFGRRQPPLFVTEEQRSLQAARVREVADEVLAADRQAAVVVLGDLNEHEFRGPLAVLTSSSLTNLIERVPAEDRYTFNFRGNSQILDHILVSAALAADAEIEILHLHADFPVPRASDHDPVLARVRVPAR